jgi:hypothetical protein
MSSSTSSFRTEAKVLCVVLLALAVCELGVRVFERRLSVDEKASVVSQQLAEGEGLRVLVLGNSLVRDGVNERLLEEEMRRQGVAPLRVERAYLMNTVINDWYYAFKHHFVDTGRLPDALVLCFAHHHLQDYAIQPATVARYYSGVRDLPQIFNEEVRDFDGRVEFLLYGWSASFAHRTNVQRRLLDLLIPHYREHAQRINDSLNNARAASEQQRVDYQPTYLRLERLLKMAQDHNVSVILVAMPWQKPYTLDPRLEAISKAAGINLIDSRHVTQLGRENFNDEMHMNEAGAAIYSRFLAGVLAEQFKRMKDAGEFTRRTGAGSETR